MTPFRPSIGHIVEHANKPEWGPGKVLHIRGDLCWLYWRDREDQTPHKRIAPIKMTLPLLRPSLIETDPVLANLPPFKVAEERFDVSRGFLTPKQAVEFFLKQFPEGFNDPEYLHREREYKVSASEEAGRLLNPEECRRLLDSPSPGQIEETVTAVIRSGNKTVATLHAIEYVALQDSLKVPQAARQFLESLLPIVSSSDPSTDDLDQYFKALCSLPRREGGARVATWPNATLLPALLQPSRHVFVKPETFKAFAEVMGREIAYDASPNAKTYSRILSMSNELLSHTLKELAPRDLIDVQGFIWVVAKY
jgi:hypothetical protein